MWMQQIQFSKVNIWILIFLIFVGHFSWGQDSEICRSLLVHPGSQESICREWSRPDRLLVESNSGNGTFVPSLYSLRREELNQYKWSINPNLQQRRQLISSLRLMIQSLKEMITQWQSVNSLNNHQKFLLHRLNNLNVVFSDEATCRYGLNGSYESTTNSMRLCGLTSYMPVEIVLTMVAHELGHAMDPCLYSAVPLQQVIQKPGAEQSFGKRQHEQGSGDVHFVNVGVNNCALGACQNVRFLGPIPTTYEGHPFFSASACVSAVYPQAPESEIQAARTEKERQELMMRHPVPINISSSIDRGSLSCNQQVVEAFADQITRKLLDYHFQKYPQLLNSRPERWTYFMLTSHCHQQDTFNLNYPRSSVRVRSVMQVRPLAEALGCRSEVTSELMCM